MKLLPLQDNEAWQHKEESKEQRRKGVQPAPASNHPCLQEGGDLCHAGQSQICDFFTLPPSRDHFFATYTGGLSENTMRHQWDSSDLQTSAYTLLNDKTPNI